MNTEVILVNEHDEPQGTCEKIQAHLQGLCHRAYSIFIFSEQDHNVLLQKRYHQKYHSGSKWTNTCCSHPQPNEKNHESAIKRLRYEMGIDCVHLEHVGEYLYKHRFENGLIEHEYDHIFIGKIDKYTALAPHPEEVSACLWINTEDLENWLRTTPSDFTPWFEKTWHLANRSQLTII